MNSVTGAAASAQKLGRVSTTTGRSRQSDVLLEYRSDRVDGDLAYCVAADVAAVVQDDLAGFSIVQYPRHSDDHLFGHDLTIPRSRHRC